MITLQSRVITPDQAAEYIWTIGGALLTLYAGYRLIKGFRLRTPHRFRDTNPETCTDPENVRGFLRVVLLDGTVIREWRGR